jgi:hypothetical protein
MSQFKRNHDFNGKFRILKWRYVNVPYFWPYISSGYSLKPRPYIGLIYGRSIQEILATINQRTNAISYKTYHCDHPTGFVDYLIYGKVINPVINP